MKGTNSKNLLGNENMGVYYDPEVGRFVYGESPMAQPTLKEALEVSDYTPTRSIASEKAIKSTQEAPEMEPPKVDVAKKETKDTNTQQNNTLLGKTGRNSAAALLMASPDPKLKAAAVGLQVVGDIMDANREREAEMYRRKMEKLAQKRQLLSNLSQVGQSLRM